MTSDSISVKPGDETFSTNKQLRYFQHLELRSENKLLGQSCDIARYF